jgi:hypothetical protein
MSLRVFLIAACFWSVALIGFSFSNAAGADNAKAINRAQNPAGNLARKAGSANAGKSASALGHMIVLNGATFFRVPVAQFPAASNEFKSRSAVKMWIVRQESVETNGQYKDGKSLSEVKSFSPAKLKTANKPGADDCVLTETWLSASSREAQDDTLSAKTPTAKSTSYWNTKGFEIPDGFELVDTETETKLTDSLLLELVNKSGGPKWMAAEFKNGEARYFIVPESNEDEFRSYFSVYVKASPKAGLELIKRFDFVEVCP